MINGLLLTGVVIAAVLLLLLLRRNSDGVRFAKWKSRVFVPGIIGLTVLSILILRQWLGVAVFNNQLITTLTLLLGLPVTVYFGKDFLRGMQLKRGKLIAPGRSIQAQGLTLQVVRLGLIGIEASDVQGRHYQIPYSSLGPMAVYHPKINQAKPTNSDSVIVRLQILASDQKKLLHKINEIVLNAPWTRLDEGPVIEMEDGENGLVQVTISVNLLSVKYGERFESYLKKKLLPA